MITAPERLVVQAGHIFYKTGDEADCAYLVLSGAVELTFKPERGPPSRIRRGAGDIFGDLALVDDSRRVVRACALSACELLVFTREQLSDRLEHVDPLLKVVISSVMLRYAEALHELRPGPIDEQPARVAPLWQTHATDARNVISFEHQLRTGLARGEFEIFFQPIVELANGRLAGFETLTRWNHPQRGLFMPADFIPQAESSGMITDVTKFCLREVGRLLPTLKARAALNPEGVDRLFATVNVSGLDLVQPAFASTAVTILCEAGVEPEDVKLEVTESTVMLDAERCARTLRHCCDHGFEIAIDDFGTGYSSLHYLNALPIGVLKVDQSFSRALLKDAGGRKIMEAIIRLGAELQLRIVAEGVESSAQAEALRAMGCDFAQGYLFGAPMPFNDALDLLGRWSPAMSDPIPRSALPAA